jgi:hypothetical protein
MAVSREGALERMREVVALWYVDQCSHADIVYAACDLLAAGLDGPALCELAAVSVKRADVDVPPLLESALGDLGLAAARKGGPEALQQGLQAMASRVLAGAIAPRVLTQRAYSAWIADDTDDETSELVESLAQLEGDYEVAEALAYDTADVDAKVIAEARWIAKPGSA